MTYFTTPHLMPERAVCVCRHYGYALDAVQHEIGCPILDELEALATESALYPSDFADPDEPVFEIDRSGRFIVKPGVDGGTRFKA